MGVVGMWEYMQKYARPVEVSSLRNKRIAIGKSYQDFSGLIFIKSPIFFPCRRSIVFHFYSKLYQMDTFGCMR